MQTRNWIQTGLYAALFIAFAYAIYHYRTQLVDTAVALEHGIWYLLLAACAVLLLILYNQATLYASLFDVLELPSERRPLFSLVLVTRFVVVAAPSGGLSAWLPLIQHARKHDMPVSRVVIANVVYSILWYSTFAIFLLAGFATLFVTHDLQWFEVSAALTLLAINGVLIIGLYLADRAPGILRRLLHLAQRLLARLAGLLRREAPFSVEEADLAVDELAQAFAQIRQADWPSLAKPIGHALLNEVLHMAVLFCVAAAFSVDLRFGVLVASYAASILFYIISPTPGGIGIVEGVMILVLSSLGVDGARAAAITLAYRGITFWLPFLFGFVALRLSRRKAQAA